MSTRKSAELALGGHGAPRRSKYSRIWAALYPMGPKYDLDKEYPDLGPPAFP